MSSKPVQIEGRVRSRVGLWESIDGFFLTLTLPDPHVGRHTPDPDPDPQVPSGQRVAPDPQTFFLQKVKIVFELPFLLYSSTPNLLLNKSSSDNGCSDEKYSNYYKYFNE